MTEAAAHAPVAAETAPAPRGRARRRSSSRSLRQVVQFVSMVVLILGLMALVIAGLAFRELLSARTRLIDRLDPARVAADEFFAALVNQQSGVRGFVINGEERSLEPYQEGRDQQARSGAELDRLLSSFPELDGALIALELRAQEWQAGFAEPEIDSVRRREPVPESALDASEASFERVRDASAALDRDLDAERRQARTQLDDTTYLLIGALLGTVLLLAGMAVGIRALISRWVTGPLARVGSATSEVTVGNLSAKVSAERPSEIADLASDIDAMRLRWADALEESDSARALAAAQAEELARSNRDLEQFAYVASHDLQEPLRKVSSFCQLLQRRYHGQLDERGDQYIDFAVDGAKRMQGLINDLLAFSRVGRLTEGFSDVALGDALDAALANLETALQESGAVVDVGDLPTLPAERPLVVQLFQNLVANAIKFKGDAPPHVAVDATRQGDEWLVSVHDNGIGIDPRFADRVFVIFQRLHPKEDYPGTGIGLALCKKIVEFHGGRIWIDPGPTRGTTICFTLPIDRPPPLPTDQETDGEQPDQRDPHQHPVGGGRPR